MPAARVKCPGELVTLKTREFSRILASGRSPRTEDPDSILFILRRARSGSHGYRADYVRSRRTDRRKKKTAGAGAGARTGDRGGGRREGRQRREKKNRSKDSDAKRAIRQVTREQPNDPRTGSLYQMEVYRDTGDFSRYREFFARCLSRVETGERESEREEREIGVEHCSHSVASALILSLARSHSRFS